jgi:peptidoglycan hydrolase-like protein with peptidoglycan-binding domain
MKKKKKYFPFVLVVTLCGTMSAQNNDQPPTGTVIDKQHADSSEVQPAKKAMGMTPDLVRAAQRKLNDVGYNSGTPDGKVGPQTRAAIRKYQQDQNLTVTGKLDENTLSHLNVGAGKTMATAPGDIGRGAKAAGHDIKEGHPIAAGKAMGKGIGRAAKAVGEGTKSGVVGTKEKVTGRQKKSDQSAPTPPQ